MPLKCMRHEGTIEEFHYTGPVLIAEGTASIDDSGKIIALGPAKAVLTVAAGKELQSGSMVLRCPECGAEGTFEQLFVIVHTCTLSGKEAHVQFKTPFGTRVWISKDLEAQAQAVFTKERAQWETPYV